MTESTTPRTDAIVARLEDLKVSGDPAALVLLDACTTIERDLQAALAEERQEHFATRELASKDRDEIERLRQCISDSPDFKDAARYRFLRDGEYAEKLLEWLVLEDVHRTTVDAAVDAAMQAPK